jgi:hypothetical protein
MIRGVGGLMLLVGGVWFLQGMGVLPGSFMTGSVFWAVLGGLVALAGLTSLAIDKLRRDRREHPSRSEPRPPVD